MVGHVAPEAAKGGPIAAIRDGDEVTIDVDDRQPRRRPHRRGDRRARRRVRVAAARARDGRAREVRAQRRLGEPRRDHRLDGGPPMATEARRHHLPRITAAMRESEQVTPLELFFDLVFVLAITQCTQLMSDAPDLDRARARGSGARGALVVVGRLRLADQRHRPGGGRGPDRDVRRDGRAAAGARSASRRRSATSGSRSRSPTASSAYCQIGLFLIASRDDADLRQSVSGSAISTAIGVGLLRRRLAARRRRPGRALGPRAGARHGRPATCSAPRAGSSCPATSPSATA